MSQQSCCVPSCTCIRENDVLHRFPNPRDPNQIERFHIWVKKIGGEIMSRDDWYIYQNRKICHKHFEEIFTFPNKRLTKLAIPSLHLTVEDQLKNPVAEPSKPKKLIIQAVPFLHLNGGLNEEDNAVKTEQQIREQDEMLEKLMDETSKSTKVQERTDNKKYGSKKSLSKQIPIAPKEPIIISQGPTERRQYAIFLEQYDNSPKKTKLKGHPDHYTNILQDDNAIYKKRITKLLDIQDKLKLRINKLEAKIKTHEDDFVTKVKETFSHVFTSNQIDMILGKKVRAWWNEVEYTKAYTLQHLSKNAYFYVRDTLNYPLPDFSSLQQWAAKFGADITDSDDEVKRPLPKNIKLTLDKITKQYGKKKKNDHTEQNVLPSDSEAIDNDHISDIKQGSKNDYSDMDKYSDKTKLSGGEDNIKVTEAIHFINVSESYENDSEMYEVIDYLDDDDAEHERDVIYNNIEDTVPNNSSDSDNNFNNNLGDYDDKLDITMFEIDNQSDECYEELHIDNIRT